MMYNNFGGGFGQGMMGGGPGFLPILGIGLGLFMIWSIVWKGLALWHSSQHKQPWWFVAFLIIHTAGILEIIYLFVVLKLKFADLFSMFQKKDTPPSHQE